MGINIKKGFDFINRIRKGDKARQLTRDQKRQLRLIKANNKHAIALEKEKGKSAAELQSVKEQYATDSHNSDISELKKLKAEYKLFRGLQYVALLFSWSASNAWWLKAVFMASAFTSSLGLGEIESKIVVWLGFFASVSIVTYFEVSKFALQSSGNGKGKGFIVAMLVSVSLITGAGMMLDTQGGARDFRASNSSDAKDKTEKGKEYAKKWSENNWFLTDGGVTTLQELEVNVGAWKASKALNTKGVEMSVTNEALLARYDRNNCSSGSINFKTACNKLAEFNKRRDAIIAYNSVKPFVNDDGTPKIKGGVSGSGGSEDELTKSLSKAFKSSGMLDIEPSTFMLIIALFMLITSEKLGIYLGREVFVLRMKISGNERILADMSIAGAWGISVEEYVNLKNSMIKTINNQHSANNIDGNGVATVVNDQPAQQQRPAITNNNSNNDRYNGMSFTDYRAYRKTRAKTPDCEDLSKEDILHRIDLRKRASEDVTGSVINRCRACNNELSNSDSYCNKRHKRVFENVAKKHGISL